MFSGIKVQTEAENPVLDTLKSVLSVALVVSGIIVFYLYQDQPVLYRVLGFIAVVVLAIVLSATTDKGRFVLGFARESRIEVRKVVWPTRQETMQTTLVVMVMVFIVGIILWLLDMFLLWGVKLLTGQGG